MGSITTFSPLNQKEKLDYIIPFLNTELNFGNGIEDRLDDAFETGVFDLASVDELDTIKTTLKHLNVKVEDIISVFRNEPAIISTKEALIKQTIDTLSQLPEDNISEVADFAAFLLSKYEDRILTNGIEKLVSDSESFSFLKENTVEYGVDDLREKY